MQNKQTSYSFKELFCFYKSNHVRLASIMQYCGLIIVVLTISRNFGVEAIYENAATLTTNTTYSPFRERTYSTVLPKHITNKNVTLSEAKLRNVQVQAVYNAVRDKILLNVSWDKPLDWNHIHSYDFKISSNSNHAYCMHESFELSKKDKSLSNIFLPPLLHRNEILPGCTYKISVVTNRSDLNTNKTDIIYSVPDCVGKKCSCRSLIPIIKKFESIEIAPGKLNISWQISHKEVNNNITNIMFEYRPSNSHKLRNNTFKKVMLPSNFNPNNSHCVLDNTDLFEIRKQYQLRAIFSNSYNCKAYSYTNITLTAIKPSIDMKQTTTIEMVTVAHPYSTTVLRSRNLMNGNENIKEKQIFDNHRSLTNISNLTTLRNNVSDDVNAGKIRNIKVQAIYDTTRYKIVLNVTWDKPLDWNYNIHSYDFKLSPNSSHCMHESPFETINKDGALTNILLPPPLNKYEILAGCTYKVSIITNRLNLGQSKSDVVYTVPECVGKKCSCSKLTPQFKNFKATENSPGILHIFWEIDQTVVNRTMNNITEITLAYRPSSSEPLHNNPFKNLALTSIVKQGSNYLILNDTNAFVAGEPYQLRGSFKNIYNCKAYLYTNFKVTIIPIDKHIKEQDKDTSWVQLTLILSFLSFITLAVLYFLRRNRLIIKEILRNPLSLSFSRRRSRRAEARTSYIMVPTITKRQQEINLLYVDKEIIDGDTDGYEFPRSRITLIREIGKGAFGQVFLAKALGIAQQPGFTYVAVKTLREKAPPEEVDDFLSEIEILKKVGEHPNVVRIFGCCILKEPYLMVMEFVPCGDLKNYLLELRDKWRRKRTRNDSSPVFSDISDGAYVLPDSPMSRKPSEGRPSVTETEYTSLESFPTPTEPYNNKVERTLDHTELQNFALQIAKGMKHLEKIPIAHRDLAARNILINEYKTLKISDFGLSRVGPYVNSRTKKLPLRWVSLEAIEDHFYDSKGDVWSYAIVLWEIGTLGAFPYEDIMDGMLLHYLQSGKRLPRPEICTDELYSLMLRCWSRDPQLRPSFQELVELLDVKKRRIYVDFNQLNPLYVFPPSKIPEFDKNSSLPQNNSTA